MKEKYINNKFLNVEPCGNTIMLGINPCLFIEQNTYEYRDALIEILDKISEDKSIKVVVVSNQFDDESYNVYKKKWNEIFESEDYEDSILRIFRILDQVLLKIVSLEKLVISMNSGYTIPMFFNFMMAADLRIVSDQFYVDNNNIDMINISKGGVLFNESLIHISLNPIKLLFLSDRIYSVALLKNNFVDELFFSEDLKNKTLEIAKHFETINYSEIEAVKAMNKKRIRKIELSLQLENQFLMTCIRKTINNRTQDIHRFH